ncbi:MAG: hypothetical protein IRZ07_02980 [Microbispora sp.]|nr:hypothetical protein [Microbispora sp.]
MGRHTVGRNAREGQPSPGNRPGMAAGPDDPALRLPRGEATQTLPVTAYAGPETTAGSPPWPVPPAEAAGNGVPWPVPPSESTARMFAALSPESLESENPEPVGRASSRLRAPSDRLVASGPPRDPGPAGPARDDRNEQPRRLRRAALVSGLSVLLAVGVTTGGARLLAGRTSLTLDQPTTACPASEACAAEGAPASGPLGGTTVSGEPTGDPAGTGREDGNRGDGGQSDTGHDGQKSTRQDGSGRDGSAQTRATPAPPAASAAPERDHPRARTHAPSSSSAPRASSHPKVGDAASAVVVDGTADTGGEAAPDDTEYGGNGADDAGTTDMARAESAPAGGAVQVRFTVTQRDENGYTARLAVRNEGPALPAWTIRLAVGGRVTQVDGAGWRQQGDTLVLTSDAGLDERGAVTLTIHADGVPAAPAGCELSEGRCEVTALRPSRYGG